MSQTCLYIIKQAPYSSAAGVEAIEAAITSANFDLQVSVLLLHDGVYQIKNGQGDSLKNTAKIFKALADFGINNLYIDQLSLDARGLSKSDVLDAGEVIESSTIKTLISEHDQVFVF